MTESHRSPSTVLWNTVLPGLGVALVLGAPMLLALRRRGRACRSLVVAILPRRCGARPPEHLVAARRSRIDAGGSPAVGLRHGDAREPFCWPPSRSASAGLTAGAAHARHPDAGLGERDRRRPAQLGRRILQPRLRGPERSRPAATSRATPPSTSAARPGWSSRGPSPALVVERRHRLRRHRQLRVPRQPGGREARRRRGTRLGSGPVRRVPLQRHVDQMRLPAVPRDRGHRRRRRGRRRADPRRPPRSSASAAATPRSASATRGSASPSCSAAPSRDGGVPDGSQSLSSPPLRGLRSAFKNQGLCVAFVRRRLKP